MSASGLNYMLNTTLLDNRRLAAYYDFSEYNGQIDPASSGTFTGILYNQFPAYDTGKYTATIMSATGAVEAAVSGLITGAVSGQGRLEQSNLKIARNDLTTKSMSAIFDFEWNQEVSNGVLFGCYDRFAESLGNQTVTGSRGFNFGADDRGNLFIETYTNNGQSIFSTSEIELSKRNIIAFRFDGGRVSLAKFDYFNDEIEEEEFGSFFAGYSEPSDFYIGGSPKYYRTSSAAEQTFSGNLNQVAIFSGALSMPTLKDLSSGMLGDYYFNTGSQTVTEVITGYSQTIVYKTGVIDVTLQPTGVLTVETGRIQYTGQAPDITGAVSVSEGDDVFVFYEFDNGSFKTAYQEKIGYLDDSNSYQYNPTGENAFDTLGLQTGNFFVSGRGSLEIGSIVGTGSYELFQQVEQTSILEEISGVINTELTELVTGYSADSSGINFNQDIESLKFDYIYYEGLR